MDGKKILELFLKDPNRQLRCLKHGKLFEYAPSPGKNVYIVAFGERYYAAIRHDENGYHGIEN